MAYKLGRCSRAQRENKKRAVHQSNMVYKELRQLSCYTWNVQIDSKCGCYRQERQQLLVKSAKVSYFFLPYGTKYSKTQWVFINKHTGLRQYRFIKRREIINVKKESWKHDLWPSCLWRRCGQSATMATTPRQWRSGWSRWSSATTPSPSSSMVTPPWSWWRRSGRSSSSM